MKKKTVITTEKREVWIIRQPSGEMNEPDPTKAEAGSADSLTSPPDQYSEIDITPDPNHD